MGLIYCFKNIYRSFISQCPYSFLNLIGLSIGLCISFVSLLYVTEESGYDSFHEKSKNIYRLINRDSRGNLNSINNPQIANAFKDQIPEIKKRVHYSNAIFKINDVVENENCFYADPDVVDIFTFNIIVGDPQRLNNNPKNIIISRTFATKHFQSVDLIDKAVEFESRNGKETYIIVAVFEDFFRKSSFKPSLIVQNVNYSFYKSMLEPQNSGSKGGQCYLLLEDRTKLKSVVEKMNKIYNNQEQVFGDTYKLQPLEEVHLHSENILGAQSGAITRLISYTIMGILILIISFINFLLLYMAIVKRRMGEFAIRKVNGLDRKGLIKMISFELICISLLSGCIAIVLLRFIVPIFNEYTLSNLVLDCSSNMVFLVSSFSLTFAIGILATLYFYNFLSGYYAIEVFAKKYLMPQ
jgi:ABC-type antimicrobial peptide transport system permease subunit